MKALGQRLCALCELCASAQWNALGGAVPILPGTGRNLPAGLPALHRTDPVRAGMAGHPAEYRWSSYRANAQGERDALLRRHPSYEASGPYAAARQAAYRALFRHGLGPKLADEVRRAANSTMPWAISASPRKHHWPWAGDPCPARLDARARGRGMHLKKGIVKNEKRGLSPVLPAARRQERRRSAASDPKPQRWHTCATNESITVLHRLPLGPRPRHLSVSCRLPRFNNSCRRN